MNKIKEYKEWFISTHCPYSMMSGVGVGEFCIGGPDYASLQKYYDELLDLNIQILTALNDLKNVYFLRAPFYYREEKRESPSERQIVDISLKHETIIKYLSTNINGAISYNSKIFVYYFIQDFHKQDDITSYMTRFCIMSPQIDIKKHKIRFWKEDKL